MSLTICVDFDGTVVRGDLALDAPLELLPGAVEGLMSLKAAGHTLLLLSARGNQASLVDPNLDPLVRAGIRDVDIEGWLEQQPLHQSRYDAMIAFVEKELPGVFDAIDDGLQGKPHADVFIDDRTLCVGPTPFAGAVGWARIARRLGD